MGRPVLGDTVRDGWLSRAAGLYQSTRTQQVVTLRAFTQGFSLNTWVGYRRAPDGAFMSADGERRALFTGDTLAVPDGFVVQSRDGDRVVYERIDPLLATTAQLAELVGWYRNEETRAVIELRQAGDHLVARRDGVLHDDVAAYFRDGFRVPSQSWLIRIRRDTMGRVNGFDLGLPRMRRLSFDRLPDGGGDDR